MYFILFRSVLALHISYINIYIILKYAKVICRYLLPSIIILRNRNINEKNSASVEFDVKSRVENRQESEKLHGVSQWYWKYQKFL